MRRSIKFTFLLLIAIAAATPVAAQNDDQIWQSLLEVWAEENDMESIPDELVEQLQDYLENPININDTASTELYNLPFVTDYHRDAIRAYIALNGPMVSPAELHLLNGFDTLTLRILRLFTTVAPVPNGNDISIKQVLRDGHSNFRTGFKTVMPRSRGYLDDKYAGDPFRLYFRYYFKYRDRIAFQLSGEKDAGESFSDQHPLSGFDNYGFYLMFNDFGRLRRAIVGKYNLQFGQGATLWSGYAPYMSDGMTLRRYGQGIRPAGPFSEYGYFSGVAATLGISRHLDLTAFYSDVDRDATLGDSLDDGSCVYRSIYNSGYHRTENEISKEHQLREQLFGGHLQYANGRLVVGATAYFTKFEDLIIPKKYVYNEYYFRGKDNFNAGIDFTWRYRRLMLFGEAAVAVNDSIKEMTKNSDSKPLAAVVGLQYHFNANNDLSIAARYGSPIYHNLYANTIGQSSDVQNDMGVVLSFRTLLPLEIKLFGTVDFFRRPEIRYRIYVPSHGVDCKLHAFRQLGRRTNMELRYRLHTDMRNVTGQPNLVEHTVRHQFTGSLVYTLSNHWTLHTRAAYSLFRCDLHESQHGVALLQDVAWNSLGTRPLSLAARVVLFDVTDYDARLYFYESELMYEFAVPMLNGRGIRTGLVMRHELSHNLSFAFKYALTYYPHQETIGSSYDLIKGNKKHEIKAQFRWRF